MASIAKRDIERSELYAPEADPVIAQRLHDEGLLWLINRLILHEVGLAIGVSGLVKEPAGDGTIPDAVTVLKLWLVQSKDQQIHYQPAEDIARRNIKKLREAGHEVLADWAERLTT